MTTQEQNEPRYFKDVCSDILSVMFEKSHDKDAKTRRFKEYLNELKQKYQMDITTLWLRNLLSDEMSERQKSDKIFYFIKSNDIKTEQIKRTYNTFRCQGSLRECSRIGTSEILNKIIV